MQRASDGATHNVGLLAAGGYANAGDHDAFCNATTCRIVRIYDQTSHHSDLTIAPDDRASQVFLDRIDQFRADPPVPEWNGVWALHAK